MRIIIIIMLLPLNMMAQKKIRISVPDGTSIDSTVLIGGYGIDAVESPANTWNVVADTSQLVTQYDITQKQDKLVSGTNIKTVNGNTLLGSGNVSVGTVTSVSATGGTGISVSGSPITGSGTLTITNTQPHQATNLSLSQSGSVVTLTPSTGTGVTLTAGTNVGFSTSGTNTTINVTGGGGGGTVTSVAIANGGGITVSGSPITTNGTITLTAADPSLSNEIQSLSYDVSLRNLSISSGNTVTIPYVGTSNGGFVSALPLSNQTSYFLRGDNTWVIPSSGGGVTNLAYGTPTTSGTYGYYVPLEPSTGGTAGVAANLYGDDGMEVKKGSSNFAGYKLNQSYANLVRTTNTGVSITSTETNVDFTGGFENGNVTYSTVNDNITLSQAGTYEVEFCTTIYTTGTTNRRVKFRLFSSTTAFPDIVEIINDIAADKYQEVSRTRIFNATAGSTISIKVSYDNTIGSGTDILYRFPSLKIKRLK